MNNKKSQQPPPGPPSRMFKETILRGQVETEKSIQWQRDYRMFMKGWNFAHGEPNIPQPGDYV